MGHMHHSTCLSACSQCCGDLQGVQAQHGAAMLETTYVFNYNVVAWHHTMHSEDELCTLKVNSSRYTVLQIFSVLFCLPLLSFPLLSLRRSRKLRHLISSNDVVIEPSVELLHHVTSAEEAQRHHWWTRGGLCSGLCANYAPPARFAHPPKHQTNLS